VRSKVTVKPTIEPVSLAEVKASLRITNTAEDALLNQYIEDARIFAEKYTSRRLNTQTVLAYYDNLSNNGMADAWWSGTITGPLTILNRVEEAVLEFAPVQSISEVKVYDFSNNETVIASSSYYLDNFDEDMRGKMVVNENNSIPLGTGTRTQNGVSIEYIAGYGDNASDVPSALRRAIILIVGHMYANRGDCDEQCAKECGAMPMLEQYRIMNA